MSTTDRPAVTDVTTRLYDSLPEFYRVADAAQPSTLTRATRFDADGVPVLSGRQFGTDPDGVPTMTDAATYDPDGVPALTDGSVLAPGYPLLRFLSLVGDLAGQVEAIADRIDVPDDAPPGTTSDLLDPDRADAAWLPWLAQLTGTKLPTPATTSPDPALTPSQYTEARRRAAIRDASGGRLVGTIDSIAAAARTALVYKPGGGYVTVTRVPGSPFLIRIRTTPEETPDPTAVLAAVEALGARPAGHVLEHSSYALAWSLLESRYPTWRTIEGTGSWSALESTL